MNRPNLSLRGRIRREDSGLTLIELLVAMSIASIIFAGVGAVMVATTQITRTALLRTQNSREVRGAIEPMVAALRVATTPAGGTEAITVAKPNEIAFYSSLNRTGAPAKGTVAPTYVSYRWDSVSSCIIQSSTVGVPITPTPATGMHYSFTGVPRRTCVAKTSQRPTFDYFVSSTTTTPLANSSSGLSVADARTVRSVQLTLKVTNPANPDEAGSAVVDRVNLSNLEVAK